MLSLSKHGAGFLNGLLVLSIGWNVPPMIYASFGAARSDAPESGAPTRLWAQPRL